MKINWEIVILWFWIGLASGLLFFGHRINVYESIKPRVSPEYTQGFIDGCNWIKNKVKEIK